MHLLDNEALVAFKAAIRANCNLQLVPLDTHCRNLAERAIQTFKSHFLAMLAGLDQHFLMYLWDQLLPQAVATLNLLQQSNAEKPKSANEYINRIFDYASTPLAPLGCAVQVHEATNQ
jgi:hypothetical protein